MGRGTPHHNPTGDIALIQDSRYPPIAGLTLTHRLVNIGELRLRVAELGQGEPLVLLHGWPQHWGMWQSLLPQLAERFRVVCPDLRGSDWSEAPSGSSGNRRGHVRYLCSG